MTTRTQNHNMTTRMTWRQHMMQAMSFITFTLSKYRNKSINVYCFLVNFHLHAFLNTIFKRLAYISTPRRQSIQHLTQSKQWHHKQQQHIHRKGPVFSAGSVNTIAAVSWVRGSLKMVVDLSPKAKPSAVHTQTVHLGKLAELHIAAHWAQRREADAAGCNSVSSEIPLDTIQT